MVVAHANLFQFILTQKMIGGKYNKWIVIMQELDLEFVSEKSKNSLAKELVCEDTLSMSTSS